MHLKLVFFCALCAAAGCATVHRVPPGAPASAQGSNPIGSELPLAPQPGPDREPLYRSPKIARIYLRAHVDASGRLVGPQVIYQIVEPGGWNLDALERSAPEPERVIDPNASWFLAPEAPAR